MRRRCLQLFPWALTLATAIVACGGQPTGPSRSASPTQTNTSLSLVTGRSAKPTDVDAPGIQVPNGAAFTVSIGNYNLTIAATDWNTIIGSSQVADLVGVQFAPDFNATEDVTRNRFQYLADKISQHYNGVSFEPLSLVSGVSNDAVVDDAALYNPADQVGKLSGLTVTMTNQLSTTTVASGTFYSTPSSAIVIPARTIYFARLTFSSSSLGPSRNNQRVITVNFHFDQFKPCPGQVCS
jgi:hypothetical protein